MKLDLSKSKYRVLLTEALPYERPLFYSNRFFARFLKHYAVGIMGNRLVSAHNTTDEGLDEFLKLLSGADARINFNYSISKDGLEKGRQLTVMHPFHQVKTMEFYDRYSSLMIGFCMNSKFSIRYPSRISSQLKWSSRFDKVIDDDAEEKITSESAKSYFHYEEVNNISRFYDSYKFLNIEKRFEHLLKVDIMDCFDSISPDRLADLVYGNGVTADECDCMNDFIFDFIRLHKEIRIGLPKRETSGQKPKTEDQGIIIGPEVSRIFAEIFMQQIDRRMEAIMKEKHDMRCPRDYAFCRYVDDSFIAANSIKELYLIRDTYSDVLKEYKLELKTDKMTLYRERPFIDGLSLVKSRLRMLIDKTFENKLSTFKGFQKAQEGKYDSPAHHVFKKFISELRVLVAETSLNHEQMAEYSATEKNKDKDQNQDTIENQDKEKNKGKSKYKDVTSYVLGRMEKCMLRLLQGFNDLYREYSEAQKKGYISASGDKIKEYYESEFEKFCIQLIESLFFILNSDLRMSTSISIVRILDILQRFVRGKYIFRGNMKSQKFRSYVISDIDEKITDETVKILRHKTIGAEYGLMEILNILELQRLMFPRNKVSQKTITKFLERTNAKTQFNFFTVFQLIHFAQGSKRYSKIQDEVKPWLIGQCSKFRESNGANTESLLTVLELLCIPEKYQITDSLYHRIGEAVDIEKIRKFVGQNRSMFINWRDYSVAEEITQRKGLNVY